MTDVQSSIINYLKTALRDDFKVGEYPFDVKTYALGDWDNVVLIQDGDEKKIDQEFNKYVHKFYNIIIWYYSNNSKHRINHILEKQALIEDLILDDNSLDNNAECIDIATVEKGKQLPDFDGFTPGYYGNRSCRKLVFRATIKQTR